MARGSRSKEEEEFVSLLECPICFCVPGGEIFNCEKGHSVCVICRKELEKCPLCSSPYTTSRNFALESLISYLHKFGISVDNCGKMPKRISFSNCIYKAEGCSRMLPSHDVHEHGQACQFRPVLCNVESSGKCLPQPKLTLSEYFEHLLNTHRIKGLTEQSGEFVKVDRLFMGFDITSCWAPFYMNYDGKTFLRYAILRGRTLKFWIQLIGPDCESRKYQAIVSLQSPKKKSLKISWTIPVHPIRSTKQEIENSQCLAAISSEKILPFCIFDEPFENRIATHLWTCNIILNRID